VGTSPGGPDPGRDRVNRRTVTGGWLTAVAVTLLVACSGGSLPAAPQAGDPACGSALAKVPSTVLGQARGSTSTGGTAVYGDPPIVVRCGVPPLGPTQLPCLSVNDVDWVIDESGDPLVFTTFGRSPAIEVRIPASYPKTGDSAALVQLQAAALALPKTSLHCIG
jgi:hypothetical protein